MSEIRLNWQPGFSLLRKPAKRRLPRRNRKDRFEFIVEHPQRACHEKRSPEHPTTVDTPRTYLQRAAVQENEPLIDLSLGTLNDESSILDETSLDFEATGGRIEPRTNSCNNDDQSTSSRSPGPMPGERNIMGAGSDSAVVSALTNVDPSLFTALPSTIEYSSLTQRFKPILNRYNKEFCTIPLTFQLRINPFRYLPDRDPEPTFLVHAVMALSGHHVNSISTLSHRHTSLQLLRQSLNAFSNPETMYSVLDTIIILFSLDEAQSIFGHWSTHLTGAYGLIEACGGIRSLTMSSRVEAQIGILTWWDAITSLLSREHCVFPYTYFDAVLSNQCKQEWDFFGLCGCPTALVKIVMQIARLTAKKQNLSSAMIFASNDPVISDIEQSLESWCHIPAPTAFRDEESMHQDQDIMHCSEAWRNGLLLYIFRVFLWEPGTSVPTRILYCARVTVDHVASCRDGSMIARQALLPLFFAGCELRDRSTQNEIIKLCSFWDEKTRYHMFRNTIPLLEEVWAEQEAKGFENVWWGQIVDNHHSQSKLSPLRMRLCFG